MSKSTLRFLGIEFAPIWIPIERRLQVSETGMKLFNIRDETVYGEQIFCRFFIEPLIDHFYYLQTFAVLCRLLTLMLLSPLGFILIAWLIFWSHGYQWIAILYISWVVYDWKTPEKGGRKWKYK